MSTIYLTPKDLKPSFLMINLMCRPNRECVDFRELMNLRTCCLKVTEVTLTLLIPIVLFCKIFFSFELSA